MRLGSAGRPFTGHGQHQSSQDQQEQARRGETNDNNSSSSGFPGGNPSFPPYNFSHGFPPPPPRMMPFGPEGNWNLNPNLSNTNSSSNNNNLGIGPGNSNNTKLSSEDKSNKSDYSNSLYGLGITGNLQSSRPPGLDSNGIPFSGPQANQFPNPMPYQFNPQLQLNPPSMGVQGDGNQSKDQSAKAEKRPSNENQEKASNSALEQFPELNGLEHSRNYRGIFRKKDTGKWLAKFWNPITGNFEEVQGEYDSEEAALHALQNYFSTKAASYYAPWMGFPYGPAPPYNFDPRYNNHVYNYTQHAYHMYPPPPPFAQPMFSNDGYPGMYRSPNSGESSGQMNTYGGQNHPFGNSTNNSSSNRNMKEETHSYQPNFQTMRTSSTGSSGERQGGSSVPPKKKPQSSKYRGVSWHKRDKAYVARVWINGKSEHLGVFASEIAAALAVDKRTIELHGPSAKNLNFPDPKVREELRSKLTADPHKKKRGVAMTRDSSSHGPPPTGGVGIENLVSTESSQSTSQSSNGQSIMKNALEQSESHLPPPPPKYAATNIDDTVSSTGTQGTSLSVDWESPQRPQKNANLERKENNQQPTFVAPENQAKERETDNQPARHHHPRHHSSGDNHSKPHKQSHRKPFHHHGTPHGHISDQLLARLNSGRQSFSDASSQFSNLSSVRPKMQNTGSESQSSSTKPPESNRATSTGNSSSAPSMQRELGSGNNISDNLGSTQNGGSASDSNGSGRSEFGDEKKIKRHEVDKAKQMETPGKASFGSGSDTAPSGYDADASGASHCSDSSDEKDKKSGKTKASSGTPEGECANSNNAKPEVGNVSTRIGRKRSRSLLEKHRESSLNDSSRSYDKSTSSSVESSAVAPDGKGSFQSRAEANPVLHSDPTLPPSKNITKPISKHDSELPFSSQKKQKRIPPTGPS